MRRMVLALTIALLLAPGASMPALADSLYTEDSGGFLTDRLGDRRSTLGPGALVTVLVTENMIASSGATTKASKQGRTQASWDFGSLIPKATKSSFDLNGRNEFQGDGVTKRADTVTLLVAATIQEILPDGSLRLAGEKRLRVNDEESTVVISGIVRPYDIDGANQIQSTKVANLQVDFRGTGSASAKATPGILSRLFNWLF
ncbi:Flagellar L-ring protein precursor [compost metagenome]